MPDFDTGEVMSISDGYELMMKFRNSSEHEHNLSLWTFIYLSIDTVFLFPVVYLSCTFTLDRFSILSHLKGPCSVRH